MTKLKSLSRWSRASLAFVAILSLIIGLLASCRILRVDDAIRMPPPPPPPYNLPPITSLVESDFILTEPSELGPTVRLGMEPFDDLARGRVMADVIDGRPYILFDGSTPLVFFGRDYDTETFETLGSAIHLRIDPANSQEPPIKVWESQPGIAMWRFRPMTDQCGNYYLIVEHQLGHDFLKTQDYRNWDSPQTLRTLNLEYQRIGMGLRSEPCGYITLMVYDFSIPPQEGVALLLLQSRDGGETFSLKPIPHDPRVTVWGASMTRDGNGNLWILLLVLDAPYSKLHLLRCGSNGEACVIVNDHIVDTERFTPTLDMRFAGVGLRMSPDAQTIVVTWHDLEGRYLDRLRYALAYSTDGGQTFSEPVLMSHIPYGWRQFHHVFTMFNNTVYFLYADTCGNTVRPPAPFTSDYRCHYWLRKLDLSTGALTSPIRITPSYKYRDTRYIMVVNVFKAFLAVGPDGRVHIAWDGNPYGVEPTALALQSDYFYVSGQY